MANKEQLEILRQGVAAWNTWREENPDAKIDLRGAKLDGLNLSGANFRKSDIRGVDFQGTLLLGTDLTFVKGGHTLLGAAFQSLIIFLCIALTVLLAASTGAMIDSFHSTIKFLKAYW